MRLPQRSLQGLAAAWRGTKARITSSLFNWPIFCPASVTVKVTLVIALRGRQRILQRVIAVNALPAQIATRAHPQHPRAIGIDVAHEGFD